MTYWNSVLHRRVDRRRALSLFGGGVAGAAFLAACGDDDKAPPTATSSPSNSKNAGSEEIIRGGKLRLGSTLDLLGMDPHVIGPNTRPLIGSVLDPLIIHDGQGNPEGSLGASWELSADGVTLVFKLRDSVTYHSGRAFTADDVVWNFDRVRAAGVPYAQFKQLAEWYPTVQAPDPGTLVLKSDRPRPAVFDYLESFLMADRDSIDDRQRVVGTGAWRWVEWRQGESLKLARNENFWREGLPYLDEITWLVAVDAQEGLAHLQEEALDGIIDPTIFLFSQFQVDPDPNGGSCTCLIPETSNAVQVMVHPASGGANAIGVNMRIAPFQDKRVRQALNWALDREQFAGVIMSGLVLPSSIPWPEASLAYDSDQAHRYKFNLEEAAKLLRAANVADLAITVVAQPGDAADFLPVWRHDLGTIGINLEINTVSAASFAAELNGREYGSLWAGPAPVNSMSAPVSTLVQFKELYGGDGDNYSGFADGRYVDLLEKAQTELDTNTQRQIYAELNEIQLDSSHTMILSLNPSRQLLTANVKYTQPWNYPFSYETTSFA